MTGSESRRLYMLFALAAALVLSMSTWFSASAVVPQLREEWGLGDGAAAWLTIAVQLEEASSWRVAFLLLVPGPLVGMEAMRRLRTA